MLHHQAVQDYIVQWLKSYCEKANMKGFVVGISGGIDSALTSTLCALTGKSVLCVNMPIRQHPDEYSRAEAHIQYLQNCFPNVSAEEVKLSSVFATFEQTMPNYAAHDKLAMANSRSRLRMMTLYALGQAQHLLVAGTGNKVEDFGIGFFTKYGDGGVDLSPIADLYKTEVYELAKYVGVIEEILSAAPTDGLWDDTRNDEDQIGATYAELEWAMKVGLDQKELTPRQREVVAIYQKFNRANQHKMLPIPVCKLPDDLM